jgi:PAS domain-containing protein
MRVSIKAEGSQTWEDLDFLTESKEIEFIRVDDFLIAPKAVQILNRGLNTDHPEPVDSIAPIPTKMVIYGIVDLVKQRIMNLHGPVQEILGYPPEILCALPFLDYIHPKDRDATIITLSMILQGRHINEFILRIVRPDGKEMPLKMTGTPADRGILAFYCSPIELPAQSSKKLIHGYYPGELLGRKSTEFIPEEDRDIFNEELRGILAGQGTPGTNWGNPITFRRVSANKQKVEVEAILLGVDFPKGRIHYLEQVPLKPKCVYHFLYDMLGNILSCASPLEITDPAPETSTPAIPGELEGI